MKSLHPKTTLGRKYQQFKVSEFRSSNIIGEASIFFGKFENETLWRFLLDSSAYCCQAVRLIQHSKTHGGSRVREIPREPHTESRTPWFHLCATFLGARLGLADADASFGLYPLNLKYELCIMRLKINIMQPFVYRNFLFKSFYLKLNTCSDGWMMLCECIFWDIFFLAKPGLTDHLLLTNFIRVHLVPHFCMKTPQE